MSGFEITVILTGAGIVLVAVARQMVKNQKYWDYIQKCNEAYGELQIAEAGIKCFWGRMKEEHPGLEGENLFIVFPDYIDEVYVLHNQKIEACIKCLEVKSEEKEYYTYPPWEPPNHLTEERISSIKSYLYQGIGLLKENPQLTDKILTAMAK